MRLGQFITANTDQILQAWDRFAAKIVPAAQLDDTELRDHAAALLTATVTDMDSEQSAFEQSERSEGRRADSEPNDDLNNASVQHGVARWESGFDLAQMVSEYRALRASVMALWRASHPLQDERDVDDANRFNESIDQSLAKAVDGYSRRLNGSRDMFLGILGHDLRNPLNAIQISATVIKRSRKDEAEVVEMATLIEESAQGMSAMIGDLLDFTQAQLGAGIPVSPAPMDLLDVCRAAVRECQAAHPRPPGAAVVLDHAGDLTGRWDAARLRQVVSNLLGNAIQHGDRDKPIAVTLSDADAEVTLAIANHGPPIPPKKLPTIFDPLVRGGGEAQRHNPSGSIGLGLYIVHEIVRAHGGRVDVASSAEAGTRFTVRLPRNASTPANKAPSGKQSK